MKTEKMVETYSSQVWLLIGWMHSLPGILTLNDGQLKFIACGSGTLWMKGLKKLEAKTGITGLAEQLNDEKVIPLFDVPLSEVQEVVFPILYFSAGVHVTVKGQKYRLSFIQPNNTKMPILGEIELETVIDKNIEVIQDITQSRRVGKKWKKVLLQE